MRLFLFISALITIFSACTSSQQMEWTTDKVSIVATGPLFEGANTGTFDWSFDLAAALEGLEKVEDLMEARLVSIELIPEAAEVLEDITIQLAGEQAGMQKVAFMDAAGNIQVAEKQENLASFFQDNYPTLVADFNLVEDWYDDYSIEARLTFSFKVRTN